MKKTFNFGKIALYGKKRINEVEVYVEYSTNKKHQWVFTASANVWNSTHTDIILGGQCFDRLNYHFKGNKLFDEIYYLWKKHHLNDSNPGTPEQMKCIENHKDEINDEDGWYIKELNLLKKYGLDVVDLNGEKYKYGTAWLYRPIPEYDIERIKKLLQTN